MAGERGSTRDCNNCIHIKGITEPLSNSIVAVTEQKSHSALSQVASSFDLALLCFDQANAILNMDDVEAPMIIVAAYRLPDTDGISFLSRTKSFWPNSIRVLLRPKLDQSWIDARAFDHDVAACIDYEHSLMPLKRYMLNLFGSCAQIPIKPTTTLPLMPEASNDSRYYSS